MERNQIRPVLHWVRSYSWTWVAVCCLVLTSLLTMSCGGGGRSGVASGAPSPPQFDHVVIVVEENHSYSSVIGNPAMPYLNRLAAQYALAKQYYGNLHPSIGNYFMLTTRQIITADDTFTGVIDQDNIVRELTAAGKSWKAYIESLPSPGYLGQDVYPYLR